MKINRLGQLGAAAMLTTALASTPAFAGPKLFAYLGNSFTFNGTTETTANGNVDPFVVELFSADSECLRNSRYASHGSRGDLGITRRSHLAR